MPHDHIETAYYFEELDEDAKENAISKLRDINVDYPDWAFPELDEAKKKLEAEGYREPEIAYSGFWNQGDGASFTCKGIHIPTWLKAHKRTNEFRAVYEWWRRGGWMEFKVIRTTHHYSHEYTVKVEHSLDYGASDKADEQAERLEAAILYDVQEHSRGIYKELKEAYEGLTSDEAVKDAIDANEYEFDERGNLI